MPSASGYNKREGGTVEEVKNVAISLTLLAIVAYLVGGDDVNPF